MDLNPVPKNLGGESLLGLNHIEFVVVAVVAVVAAAVVGDNLCQTRLIVDVHP